MGGVTSSSFGILIAFWLPGLVGLFGLTLWSKPVSRMFSTFLTSNSNAGLFLLLILAALITGLAASVLRWILLERMIFPWLFKNGRVLIPAVTLGERKIFRGIQCAKREPIKRADYTELAKSDARITAYRAFIDEVYRFYQWWGGLVVTLPIVLAGWIRRTGSSVTCLAALSLAALVVEIAVVAKAADSWIDTCEIGRRVLGPEGGANASKEEVNRKEEVDGEEEVDREG